MGCAISFLVNMIFDSVQGIGTAMKHLAVTEKKPHDIERWICTMNLGDHLITHFLVATIEQLRKCGSRDDTSVSELRI